MFRFQSLYREHALSNSKVPVLAASEPYAGFNPSTGNTPLATRRAVGSWVATRPFQSLYREHALSNRSLLHPSQSPSIAFVRLRTRSPKRLARGPVKDGVFGHLRSFRRLRARPPEPGNSFVRAQSRSYALSAGAASSFGVCRLRCRTPACSAGSPAQGTAAHRQRPARSGKEVRGYGCCTHRLQVLNAAVVAAVRSASSS